MKAKKFALILVAVLIAALLAGCLAACNKDEKPVLTVTIGSQQVPYSPDGAKPYTDGTQVQVDGLPDGYTIELGLSAQFGGVPVPGDSVPLVFDQHRADGFHGLDACDDIQIKVIKWQRNSN